jgi:hypothetical protein
MEEIMKKKSIYLKFLSFILSLFLAIPLNVVSALAAATTTEIKHESPGEYYPGFRIKLDAEVTDDVGIMVARCYFKTKKQENFVFVNMAQEPDSHYLATLPAPWVNSESIDYVFVVVNTEKKVVRSQVFTIEEEDTEAAATWEGMGEVREMRLDVVQEAVEEYEVVANQLRAEVKGKLSKYQTDLDQGQLDVNTELDRASEKLMDFYDKNVVVSEVPDYLKYGLLAEGLYTDAQIAAAGGVLDVSENTGAASAGSIKAVDGGLPWGWIALGTVAVGGGVAVAVGSGGSGGGHHGGGVAPPPSGGTLLASFTAPDPQSPPYIMQIISHNAVLVPADLTYNGAPIGDGSYQSGIEDFPLPGVGGVVRFTLTSDVSGGSLEFHFSTGGGRQPAPFTGYPINGNVGDYIDLHTR